MKKIITIKDFLQGNGVAAVKVVPSGNALTPQELYDNCISVPFPDNPVITQTIIEWHKLLSWYADQKGAVLLSRLYESKKDASGVWNNRRNSLTFSKNYNYAFCSNHFARVILTMALNGFVPSKEDFWDMMVTKREFYLSSIFGMTPVEKRISAYSQKIYNCKFYTPGWYLAHIVSVNDMPYKDYEDINVENIFKLGNEFEWKMDANIGCMVRKNNDELNTREKNVAIAHFLRCLDPINYFLVPNENNVIYKKINPSDGAPLGENKYVVQFMLIKAYERFGKIFEDFLKRSLADLDIACIYATKLKIASERINAEYAPGINQKSNVHKYTVDDEFKVAAYYLRNKNGLVDIEKEVLNVDDKLGFDAKQILNKHGIDTSRKSVHKGLLIKSSIDDEILKASGIFKTTLEEIRKRRL